MAQSRLEKVGTIYTRMCSLIKAGAIKEENRPMWLDIYNAFPPKYEPRFDRPGSQAPVRKIFYPEDLIRARFHKDFKHFSTVNLFDANAVSKTEQFITIYKQLEKEGVPEAEIYDKAVKQFERKFEAGLQKKQEAIKLAQSKSETRLRREINIKKFLAEEQNENEEQENVDQTQYKPIRLSIEKLLKDNVEKKSE